MAFAVLGVIQAEGKSTDRYKRYRRPVVVVELVGRRSIDGRIRSLAGQSPMHAGRRPPAPPGGPPTRKCMNDCGRPVWWGYKCCCDRCTDTGGKDHVRKCSTWCEQAEKAAALAAMPEDHQTESAAAWLNYVEECQQKFWSKYEEKQRTARTSGVQAGSSGKHTDLNVLLIILINIIDIRKVIITIIGVIIIIIASG